VVATSRRRLRVGVTLGAALLLGLGLWLVRSGPPPAQPVANAEAAPPPAPAPVAAPPPVAAAPVAAPPPAAELPEAVQRYLEATVYPPDSGRLEEGALDLLEPNRRWEDFRRVPGAPGVDPDLHFLWTCDRVYYLSDQVVEARFEARRGDAPLAVASLEAFAQPEGRAGPEGEALPLRFRREGDAWLAELELARELERHHGPVALTARYGLPGAPVREETIRIFVTPADGVPARFTGAFADRVGQGGLEIEVGVQVDEPGFYRVDANLHAAGGAPLGWAVFKGELAAGAGALRLVFFGKALHDAGQPGPYTLRGLRGYLFRDAAFPDRLHMRDYPGSWTTRPWELSDFSPDEWDGEHRRHMVELMLEDERRGIALDLPPDALE
jgi:hypothetical protein